MFISSKEKISLQLRITVLEGRVQQLSRSLNSILDAMPQYKTQKPLTNIREYRNAYARDYYQRKKAEKAKAAA